MSTANSFHTSNIPNLTLLAQGKVRDIYALDADYLLIVATDRLSAYDVVLPNPVPDKGRVLTGISKFWFAMMEDLIPNHLTGIELESVLDDVEVLTNLDGRALVCKRLRPLPIEAVVRGYLIGSGWRDYLDNGSVCGISLPDGMQQAQLLPEVIYTPATKAAVGDHDENISYEHTVEILGVELARHVRDISISIYTRAAAYALERGVIIADTKFEFGQDDAGNLYLIDEILTPDSSRFWPLADYHVGTSPPSYDKQFVRDYLDTLDWDKTPPGPSLPAEVIQRTSDKYQEAWRILTE